MGDVDHLVPIVQSSSGFAQSRTVVIQLTAATTPAARADEIADNATLLGAAHHMMQTFDATSRAARTALIGEAGAIFNETLDLSRDCFAARTLTDLIDLHSTFAQRRFLAATAFATSLLMPPPSNDFARDAELMKSA